MNKDISYSVRLKVDNKTKMQTLILEGELGIGNADAIKSKLQTLNFTSDLSIKIKNVETLDLSSLQLIYSLVKTLHSKGFKTSIESELPERMQESLRNTGFLDIVKA